MGWHLAELLEEAWRRTGRLFAAIAVALAGCAAALVLSSASDLSAAVAARSAAQAAGVDIFTVSVADDERLTAVACQRLERSSGVVEHGMYYGENIVAAAVWLPSGAPVPLVDISPGALRAWWPTLPPDAGVFVGRDLQEVTGLAEGMTLQVSAERLRVTGTLPAAVRPSALQASVVRVVPDLGDGPECWFRVAPGVTTGPDLAAAALFENQVLTTPFAAPDDLSQDPVAILQAGLSRWGAVAAALVIAGLTLVTALIGRVEFAVYRATGTSMPDLTVMTVLQWAVVVAVAVPTGTVSALLLVAGDDAVPFGAGTVWFLVQPVAVLMLFGWGACPLITVAASAGSIVDRLRD